MPFFGITMQDVRRVFVVDEPQRRNSPENPSVSLSQPGTWLTNLLSGPSVAGVNVNQETSLGITAVWRAVRVLSEGVAGLQGDVFREDATGNKQKLKGHRVAMLMREPSPLFTGFGFKETLTAFAALRGNGLAVIEKNGSFTVLDPTTVKTKYQNGLLIYTYENEDGKRRTLDSSKVLHVPALAMDPGSPMGKSPLAVHRETLGLSIAQTRYGAKFFKNGAHIDGFLSTDQKIDSEKMTVMARSWRQRYTGLENAGSTPVLEQGLKYVPLSLSPQDALFVESSQLSVQDVARIFGVPLHMLASLERATFSNIEHQSREFVTYTLRPWVKRWEEEINRKLFTEEEKQAGFYYRFNLESLLRGDSESRAKLIDSYMKWGIATRDEVRRLEGWNDSQDDTGGKHFVPVNMVPAEMVGQQQEIPFPGDQNNESNE